MSKYIFSNDPIKKYSNVIVFAFFLMLPIILYWDVISTNSVMVSGDGTSYLMFKELLKQGALKGELPLWNRFLATGIPYMADIQNAFFYPFNIISLFTDTATFTNIFYTLHLSLAGFFMYLYMKELQDSKIVALVTGIIFACSSIIGGPRKNHINIVATIIWLPLILYLIEKFRDTRNKKYIIFSAIIMAIQFFAGFPQTALYCNIVVFIYFLYILILEKVEWKKTLQILLGWIGIYIILIAIQVIPLAEQIAYSGREDVSFEFFSVLSYDWKVLPMMIFPELYWNIYEPFGAYASSGIDIEIYFGVICFMYALYFIPVYLKEKKTKLFSIIIIGSLIFGAAANIPILGRLLWHMPIIGSFRVISRVLYIFVFFCLVLFGLTLSKIRHRSELKKFIKYNTAFLVIILVIRLIVTLLVSKGILESQIFSAYGMDSVNYWIPIIAIVISLIILIISDILYDNKTHQYVYVGVCVIICISTVVDIGRFSLKYNSTPIEGILHIDTKEAQLLRSDANSTYRSWATITDRNQYFDEGIKISKNNLNIINENMMLNSYNTFHDPRLINVLGNEIYSNANEIVRNRNDLLSMLSVKYLLDAWANIDRQDITSNKVLRNVYSVNEVDIPNSQNELVVWYDQIELEEASNYKVEFYFETSEIPKLFYLDLYSSDYDNAQQDIMLPINEGKNYYSAIINTGSEKLPDVVVLRIITQTEHDIRIENLTVNKLESIPFDTMYSKVIQNDDIVIYENKNVKPLLYMPSNVQSISEDIDIYSSQNYNNLDTVSYVQEFKDLDLTNVITEISNIVVNNNKVSARVSASEDIFINHTQSMYPSWKAYVDGKKTKIYLVNGIIQGIEVPKGEHTIEFIFEPNTLYIGATISIAGIIFILIYLLKTKKQ